MSKKSHHSKKNSRHTETDLNRILEEADKITLKDLEFDRNFKEQSTILCDIKNLLQKEKGIKQSTCNLIKGHKTDNRDFNQLYKELKTKYTARDSISSKHIKKSRHTKKKSSKSHSRISKSKKQTKNTKINTGKINTGNINTRYPVVLINKSKPIKNLLYVNMNSKLDTK